MNIDPQTFFREATLRICGSLDVETFLYNSFIYIRNFIPADQVALLYFGSDYAVAHFDAEQGQQVLLATATEEGAKRWHTSLPQTTEVIRYAKGFTRPTPVIEPQAKAGRIARQWVTAGLLAPDAALMTLPLTMEGQFIGSLVLIANPPGQFTQAQADLITLVNEPFAIALCNSIRYQKLEQIKDLLRDDNRFLRQELLHISGDEIIGADFGLNAVMHMVRQVAASTSPVLLLGETGTGKEVIASAIHHLSARNQGAFIKVNCGAIPESLMDSELFGHEKGAFTGALTQKKGRFERASGGTIFLDEVGELALNAQVRLLRVLQEKEIERVGGTAPMKVDIRVIAATHRDLRAMIAAGTFREDLFFRLNVFPITIPPLRSRPGDIPALLQHFLHKKSHEMGRSYIPDLAPGVAERLSAYSWPGNVRELENAVERELILHVQGPLTFEDLPVALTATLHEQSQTRSAALSEDQIVSLDTAMADYIQQVLKKTGGRIEGPGGAAELLCIHPSTLRKRLRKLGVPFGRIVSHKADLR